MTTAVGPVSAPAAPGRLGQPLETAEALAYLQALSSWRDQREAELRVVDEAALQSPDASAYTSDLVLSMALWKAVSDRYEQLAATWASGRVGRPELERLSTLVWGRLDSGPPVPSVRALAVSLPEACRLSDALVTSLRVRLGLDSAEADVTARLRQLRAAVERVRDLVADQPPIPRPAVTAKLTRLTDRWDDLSARQQRGADVGGLLGPLENDVARMERDLIVAASRRSADARDEARAATRRAELEASGAALRDLADRCVAQVRPAPRHAVPDVATLGPVPSDPLEVDVYLRRLEAVGRAMSVAHDAYAAALSEREELHGLLQAYAAKASATTGASSRSRLESDAVADLADLEARAQQVLSHEPVDLVRARALVAAYQAYLLTAQGERERPLAKAGGGTP